MRINARLLFLTVVILSGPGISQAQVSTGTPPLGSFDGGPDIVNVGNLNVHLTFPVRHKAGRGTNFDYDLTYDSSIWYPASGAWKLVSSPSLPGWAGLAQAGEAYIGYGLQYSSGQCTPNGSTFYWYYVWSYSGFFYYDTIGVRHNFPGGFGYIQNNSGGSCGPAPGYQPNSNQQANLATDGSGYTLYLTPVPNGNPVYPYLIDKSGANLKPPVISNPTQYWGSSASTDRNGNQITSSNGSYTDTLGQNPLNIVGTAPSNTNLSYTAPSGGTATFVVSYKSYTVKTNFGCGGIAEYGPTSNSLVDRITLPDGSYYQFGYETTYQDSHSPHYVTGRIASVQLPTGGTISYQYATGGTGVNGISCSDGAATTLVRTTNPGGPWTYVRTQISGNHWQTKVTTPPDPTVGDDTVIDFQKDNATPPAGDQNTNNFYETQRLTYQGSSSSGTLLQTATTCYNGNTSSCATTSVSSPISQRNVTTQFGSSGLQALQILKYNGYGLLTEEDDYDYASGTPTTVLRQTLTGYASLGNGIVSMPASVTVKDGGGTIKAQTTYTYDQGSVSTSSGTPQHVSVSGSRGNATTISSFVAGSTSLSKTFTYWDTGMVNVATDVNSATTTYSYAGTSCGNAFPTSVSEPLGLSKSFTWNCAGGVLTQVADENSQNTTTSYTDQYFWRPASVTDPTSAVTNYSYPTSAPYNWTESYMNFSSSTVDVLTTVDGLGRAILQQKRQGPGSNYFDTIETDYDSFGRVAKVSLPFSTTAGATNPSAVGTSTQYDPLNRPTQVQATYSGGASTTYGYPQNDVSISTGPPPTGENSKQRQLEYNGLGQLTSVCEITSTLPGNGNCGQNAAANGYLTKYTYTPLGQITGVTQNAQPGGSAQTRTYVYDLLGRLTSETNPESGTKNYVYDSDSSMCGNGASTSNGNLVKTTDAAGNCVMFYYDGLHRLTDVGNSNQAANGCLRFRYDNSSGYPGSTKPPGLVNTMGRLIEAATDACGTSDPILTDEWFSYTTRGEASDIYEKTPNSGSYYHVTESYAANGSVSQLSGLPGLPTITYGVDPEGRNSTASASSGQNPLTGTNYNVAGLPTQVSLGSGDSDAYAYDPNTFRMTQYQFNVNGQSESGTLTWNAIGTLAKLVISDPFNSSDNQTCNYSHDDLVRLVSANCGSIWTQNFSYDPFGNITASGSGAFAATYTTATNHMNQIGGQTPSYDGNGNVTNDFLHTYAWNVYGHPTTIDGIGVTYDAQGRMVEEYKSGSYTQIVYSPTGQKLAFMNGQTLSKAYVPLPAGALAVYGSSGLSNYHHMDWLGNFRLGTSPSRTVLYDIAYGPFGDAYIQTGGIAAFTGPTSDTNANLYDFPSREYGIQGRWPSPDPAGIAAVDPSNPQSWNRYAYVLNNPLTSTDPLGLMCYPADFAMTSYNNMNCSEIPTCPPYADCGGDGGGGGNSGNDFPPVPLGYVGTYFSASYNGPPLFGPAMSAFIANYNTMQAYGNSNYNDPTNPVIALVQAMNEACTPGTKTNSCSYPGYGYRGGGELGLGLIMYGNGFIYGTDPEPQIYTNLAKYLSTHNPQLGTSGSPLSVLANFGISVTGPTVNLNIPSQLGCISNTQNVLTQWGKTLKNSATPPPALNFFGCYASPFGS